MKMTFRYESSLLFHIDFSSVGKSTSSISSVKGVLQTMNPFSPIGYTFILFILWVGAVGTATTTNSTIDSNNTNMTVVSMRSATPNVTYTWRITLSQELTATTYTRNPSPTPTTYTRDLPVTESGEHTLTLGMTHTRYTLSITSYTRIASATPTEDATFTVTLTRSSNPTSTQTHRLTRTHALTSTPSLSLTVVPVPTRTMTDTRTHYPTSTATGGLTLTDSSTLTAYPTLSETGDLSVTESLSATSSTTISSSSSNTRTAKISPSLTVAQCKRILCTRITLNGVPLAPHAASEEAAWRVSHGTYYFNEAEGEDQDSATENGISHHYHYCHIAPSFTMWAAGGQAIGMRTIKRLLLGLVVPCGAGHFIGGTIEAPLFGIKSTFPFEYSATDWEGSTAATGSARAFGAMDNGTVTTSTNSSASTTTRLNSTPTSITAPASSNPTTMAMLTTTSTTTTTVPTPTSTTAVEEGPDGDSLNPYLHCGSTATTLSWVDVALSRGWQLVNGSYVPPDTNGIEGLSYTAPSSASKGRKLSSSFRLFNIPSAVGYPYLINITMTYVCPTNNKQNIIVMLLELRGPGNEATVLDSSQLSPIGPVMTKATFDADSYSSAWVAMNATAAARGFAASSVDYPNLINAVFSTAGSNIDLSLTPSLVAGISSALVPYMAIAEAIVAWVLWASHSFCLGLPIVMMQVSSAFAMLRISQCAVSYSSRGTAAYGQSSVAACGAHFSEGLSRVGETASDENTSGVFSAASVPWLWGYSGLGEAASTYTNLPPLSVGYTPGPDGLHSSFPWLHHPLRFPLATPSEYSELLDAMDAVKALRTLAEDYAPLESDDPDIALVHSRVSVAASEVGRVLGDRYEHLYLRGTIMWCLVILPILTAVIVRYVAAPVAFWLLRVEGEARRVLVTWQRREVRKRRKHRHHRREQHRGTMPSTSPRATRRKTARLLYEPDAEEQVYLSQDQGGPRLWRALSALGWPWVILVPMIATAHGTTVAIVRLISTMTESGTFSGDSPWAAIDWLDILNQPEPSKAFGECLTMLNAPSAESFYASLVSSLLYGDRYLLASGDTTAEALMQRFPKERADVLYRLLSTSDDVMGVSRDSRAFVLDRAMAICGAIILAGALTAMLLGIVCSAPKARRPSTAHSSTNQPPALEVGSLVLPYTLRDVWESIQRFYGTAEVMEEVPGGDTSMVHSLPPRLPCQLLLDLDHCDLSIIEQAARGELMHEGSTHPLPANLLGPRRPQVSRLEWWVLGPLTSVRPCLDRLVFDQVEVLEGDAAVAKARADEGSKPIGQALSPTSQQPTRLLNPMAITDDQLSALHRVCIQKAWEVQAAIPKTEPLWHGHRWQWSLPVAFVASIALAIAENVPTATADGCGYKMIVAMAASVLLFIPMLTFNAVVPLICGIACGVLLMVVAVCAFLYGSPAYIQSIDQSDLFGSEAFFTVMLLSVILICAVSMVSSVLRVSLFVRFHYRRYFRATRIISLLGDGRPIGADIPFLCPFRACANSFRNVISRVRARSGDRDQAEDIAADKDSESEMVNIATLVAKSIGNDAANELRRREHEATFSLPQALAIPLLEEDPTEKARRAKTRGRLPITFTKPKQMTLAQMANPETFSSSDSEEDIVGLEDIDLDGYCSNIRLLRNDEKIANRHYLLPMTSEGFLYSGFEDLLNDDDLALDLGLPKGPSKSHETPRTVLEAKQRTGECDPDEGYTSYTSCSYTSSSVEDSGKEDGGEEIKNDSSLILEEEEEIDIPEDADALDILLTAPYPRPKRQKVKRVIVTGSPPLDAEELELQEVSPLNVSVKLARPTPRGRGAAEAHASHEDPKATRRRLAKDISLWKGAFLEANGRKPKKSELMADKKMGAAFTLWHELGGGGGEVEAEDAGEKDPIPSAAPPRRTQQKKAAPIDYAKGLPLDPTERLPALKRRLGQRKSALVSNDPSLGSLSLRQLADRSEEIAVLMQMYSDLKTQLEG